MTVSDWGPNPGYAAGQLARALATEQEHGDPAARARAGDKAANWRQVLAGMFSGALKIGSRTPIRGQPAWATPKVMTGGFATGDLLAGGELEPHEEEWLRRFTDRSGASDRARLNGYFLSDDGVRDLQQILESGGYRVQVPEEGALMVVAWLLRGGQVEAARAVLEEIGPFFNRLRFYPIPHPRPLAATGRIHLETVGRTIERLEKLRNRDEVETMREALRVWAPLEDQAVRLFVETVEGDLPSLLTRIDGTPIRSESGSFRIDGGWPCQRFPAGWRDRARKLLDDYQSLRARHRRCRKPERPMENFARLRGYLRQCVRDPAGLSGADVGMIRLILASIRARRGLPGTARHANFRQLQRRDAKRPTVAELAKAVVARLAELPADDGLDDLEAASAPLTAEEARRFSLPPRRPLPEKLTDRLARCLDAPVEVLIERGIIPSGEVLAEVIPQITSQAAAAAIEDPDLRRLYRAIYLAFRRRRSLLLLNLEHQVELAELPWVAATLPYRGEAADARGLARQALEQVIRQYLTAFPHMILPNKLLQEIRALCTQGQLNLPIVDELAADIFMGAFSAKFLRAAQLAADRLEGTLYETYYQVPYRRVQSIHDVIPSRYGTSTSAAFYKLCCELAGEPASGGKWSVARNGGIIEQSQILTSHNLAVLFGALGLEDALRPLLPDLARKCFTWICWRLQLPADDWHRRLKNLKNAAYAWRQMIFYLSLLPTTAVDEHLSWAAEHLAGQREPFQTAFRTALAGLQRAARGAPAEAGPAARRFLGWTTGKHWLHLPPSAAEREPS